MIPKPIKATKPTSPGAGAMTAVGSSVNSNGNASSNSNGNGNLNNSIFLSLGRQISNSSGDQVGQKNYSPVILGLAALILEGRPISEDEYQSQQPVSAAASATVGLPTSSVTSAATGGGRQSPQQQQPSTSRAAALTALQAGRPINITANPYAILAGGSSSASANANATVSAIHQPFYGNSNANNNFTASSSPITAASSPTSSASLADSKHQRWAQKIVQLRKLSPAAQSITTEPELVSLAINDARQAQHHHQQQRYHHHQPQQQQQQQQQQPQTSTTMERNGSGGGGVGGVGGGSSYEIVQRVTLNCANIASSTPTPESNTAMKNATLPQTMFGDNNSSSSNINSISALSSSLSLCLPSTAASNNSNRVSSPDKILQTLQTLATTCLRVGSHTSQSNAMELSTTPPGAAIASAQRCSGSPPSTFAQIPPHLKSPSIGNSPQLESLSSSSSTSVASTSVLPSSSALPKYADSIKETLGTTAAEQASNKATSKTPKVGPHCDQFLKKVGLTKLIESSDLEEHYCDMSYVNVACSRWRANRARIEAIIEHNEPVCIEVYLGPEKHKILLEQWIISGKEKMSPPTMTLPSLCSAIRSQLYFSQIVAWRELLKTTDDDDSVLESGRVIPANARSTAAGDLATTNAEALRVPCGPRLNVFHRIRKYDATAGFMSKPNVHNFPNIKVSENYNISVCVKSLPRLHGGLPPIGCTTPAAAASHLASTPTQNGSLCATTPTGLTASLARSQNQISDTNNCDSNGHENAMKTMMNTNGTHVQAAPVADEMLTHREKQLQKYLKRMQRRDKRHDRSSVTPPRYDSASGDSDRSAASLYTNGSGSVVKSRSNRAAQAKELDVPMHEEMGAAAEQQFANSKSQMQAPLKISASTQTPNTCCEQCGSEKQLVCVKCTQQMDEDVDVEGDVGGGSNDDEEFSYISTPRSQAEILLQAIQRTPKNKTKLQHTTNNDLKQEKCSTNQNNNYMHFNSNSNSKKYMRMRTNCHTCKRQKTQHTYKNGTLPTTMTATSSANEEPTAMQLTPTSSLIESADEAVNDDDDDEDGNGDDVGIAAPHVRLMEHDEQPYEDAVLFKTPKRVIQQSPRAADAAQRPNKQSCSPKPNNLRIACSFAELNYACGSPRTTGCSGVTTLATAVSGTRRLLPKVNLTPIFCSNSSSSFDGGKPMALSAPITLLDNDGDALLTPLAFSFENATTSAYTHTQSHSTVAAVVDDANAEAAGLRVQKSYSAPTLPNSLSLSPRFAKQATFYKRRSRHLSERSDRSSLCSDEPLSDEDLDSCSAYSPAGSPLKNRLRLLSRFGRRPLLGNLEEALLQKRLMPSTEAGGFRLLLSASGSFCPTQLSKPVVAYFYELRGETLSTPYLCETRLPHKGYCVPVQGNVQATLLNPEGSVVRMFVIPYDMRDMPPWHQTFVRQRILASVAAKPQTQNNNNNNNTAINNCNDDKKTKPKPQQQQQQQNGCCEQQQTPAAQRLSAFLTTDEMKRLRYSIHLRFQTSRSGRLLLHSDVRLLISRRTDCDTAAAYARNMLESPNELITDTMMPTEPKYSARPEHPNKI